MPANLYEQIYNDILEKISGDDLVPGDKLPTEGELMNLYGVSRTPVRQALGDLQREGYVERRPGQGTFVTRPRPAGAWSRLSGFGHVYRAEWENLDSKTHYVEVTEADEECATALGLAAGSDVIDVGRSRLWRGDAAVVVDHYLPVDAFDIEVFQRAGDFFSIRDLIDSAFDVFLREAEEAVRAVGAPEPVANRLNVSTGAAVLYITRRSFDYRRRCLAFARYYVETETIWFYSVRLTAGNA